MVLFDQQHISEKYILFTRVSFVYGCETRTPRRWPSSIRFLAAPENRLFTRSEGLVSFVTRSARPFLRAVKPVFVQNFNREKIIDDAPARRQQKSQRVRNASASRLAELGGGGGGGGLTPSSKSEGRRLVYTRIRVPESRARTTTTGNSDRFENWIFRLVVVTSGSRESIGRISRTHGPDDGRQFTSHSDCTPTPRAPAVHSPPLQRCSSDNGRRECLTRAAIGAC